MLSVIIYQWVVIAVLLSIGILRIIETTKQHILLKPEYTISVVCVRYTNNFLYTFTFPLLLLEKHTKFVIRVSRCSVHYGFSCFGQLVCNLCDTPLRVFYSTDELHLHNKEIHKVIVRLLQRTTYEVNFV